ncbi:hypothetical protein SB861_40235 [Paraburkholderia sp. SIMBA_049]
MSRFGEAEDPRRRLVIGALAASALVSVGRLEPVYAASLFGGVPRKLPPDQSVFSVDGTCTVNGKDVTTGTRIMPGDAVITGPRSQLIFVVGDTAMLMRDNSQLQIGTSADGNASGSAVTLVLSAGKMLSVFAPGRPVRIDTPTALIGIRGTGLYLETDPEQTYFCTCFGVTDVVAKDDPQSKDTVSATHHDRPLFIAGGNKTPGKAIRPAPFKNHTDQELALIETLVGRVLPPSFPSMPDSRYLQQPRGWYP